MEVKIGVVHAAREISIDAAVEVDELEKLISQAVTEGGLLTLADNRGRRVVIPADKLAYVDIANAPAGVPGFRPAAVI